MDLGRLLPLVLIICATCLGALMYLLLVMSYRRQQEADIERKQRERRELVERSRARGERPPPTDPG